MVLPLKHQVERDAVVHERALPALEEEIQKEVHDDFKVRPDITRVEPIPLERATNKPRLIEYLHEKE